MHLSSLKENIMKHSLQFLTASYLLNNFIAWKWQILVSNGGQGNENPVKMCRVPPYIGMNTGFEFLVL